MFAVACVTFVEEDLECCCAFPQAHPFFNGVDWERLYSQRPPYTPVVAHELDTRNFENFEVRRLSGLPAHVLARCSGSRGHWMRCSDSSGSSLRKQWSSLKECSGVSLAAEP